MAGLTLSWIDVAALMGAAQGIILAAVLIAQRRNRTANRLLGVMVITFTIFLGGTVYNASGAIRVVPHFFGVTYFTPWVYGPLVYLYSLAASDRSWHFRRRDLIHFVPAAIAILAMMPSYLLSGPEKIELWQRVQNGDSPGPFVTVIDPLKFISGIGYSIATIVHLRRHRRLIEDDYSNTDRVNLRWLIWLTAAAVGIWILAIALKLSPVSGTIRDEHISLAMSLLIYAIGYLGLRQPEVFRYETAEYPVPEMVAQYERSGLAIEEAVRIRTQLVLVMENEQPWKNSELTLSDLATRLATSPHKLSEILNSQVGQTFYDFVNGYRVREVQRRIAAGDAKSLKMLALAMDAGFASKSTFNEAFKKHTNLTPSGFRQSVEGASA